jgi:hypothetical protein
MDNKRVWAVFLLPLLAVSFLGAQSLADLSKKEKERRASVKGKKIIITNDDLAKVKKKASVIVAQTEAAPGESDQADHQRATGNAPAAASRAPFTVQAATSGKAPLSEGEQGQTKEALKERWATAQEMVDLLTMKMNALWQKFYNMDDMSTRDSIQLQISETYQKLLKAQEDEAKAKEELETFLSNTRKD